MPLLLLLLLLYRPLPLQTPRNLCPILLLPPLPTISPPTPVITLSLHRPSLLLQPVRLLPLLLTFQTAGTLARMALQLRP